MGHGQEPARNAQLPGGYARSPVQKNGRDPRIIAHHFHIRKSALRPNPRSQGFRHGFLGRKAGRQARDGVRVFPAISPLIRGADAQRKRLPVFLQGLAYAFQIRQIHSQSCNAAHIPAIGIKLKRKNQFRRSIAWRISLTACSIPTKRARETIVWPMFSSCR